MRLLTNDRTCVRHSKKFVWSNFIDTRFEHWSNNWILRFCSLIKDKEAFGLLLMVGFDTMRKIREKIIHIVSLIVYNVWFYKNCIHNEIAITKIMHNITTKAIKPYGLMALRHYTIKLYVLIVFIGFNKSKILD